MPTLSIEGSVFVASEVSRQQLVAVAPSVAVTMTMARVQSALPEAETHEVYFNDLPDNKANVVLLSISEGDVDVVITDDNSDTTTFNMVTSSMIMHLGTLITGLTITANSDSVYDLIAGA